jgi:glycerophosphoryl diester phosphodiesterase
MLRVGHGGAGALVRGNTLASFDAALEHGVDMVEFDVRARRRELVVAHTAWDTRRASCPTLRAALDHLAGRRFDGLRFDVDVKQPGIEAATLYALEAAGLTDRCLISSQLPRVLDRVRELDPSVQIGISVAGRFARRRQGWADWRSDVLAALAQRRFDAVMAHHTLVDARLSDGVRERAGELFAWTVDDRALVDRLRRTGVSGVISNDPRLFAPATAG